MNSTTTDVLNGIGYCPYQMSGVLSLIYCATFDMPTPKQATPISSMVDGIIFLIAHWGFF